MWQVAVKEVYKAKIIKKTADGKIPLEVALMQQVRSQEQTKMFLHTDTQTQTQAQTTDTDHTLR